LAIKNFKSKNAARLFERLRASGLPQQIERRAHRRLLQLHFAEVLDDLRLPPSNHLEALGGDRKGQHSIRINRQFRICFKWNEGNACDVEIVDYH
jgi:proteic killer suppression protein